MAAMQLMARYVRNFRRIAKSPQASGEEMLLPSNWELFKEAILCGKANDNVELNASATISNTIDALRADYAMQDGMAARLREEELQITGYRGPEELSKTPLGFWSPAVAHFVIAIPRKIDYMLRQQLCYVIFCRRQSRT